MHHQSIKNLFIAGLTLLSFGFLSAQFVIPSGINNALQIIQRVLVTTTGTSTGAVVMDTNTGSNKIYINPAFLPISQAYSGQYVLTLGANGYLSFASGSVGGGMSGAYLSGGNLYLAFNNGSTANLGGVTGATGAQGTNGQNGIGIVNIVDNNGTFTVNLSNGSGYTVTVPGGSAQYWTQSGNDLYPTTLTNNIGIGTNSPSEQLTVDGSFSSTNNDFVLSNTDTTFDGDPGVGMQGSNGDQQYWMGINDDGNGFFTNELSYRNTTTNTYTNFGVNPLYGAVMNRWDDISTFPGGRSSIAVDTNGAVVIGKSTGSDTNMIWYNDNFDTLMHLQNDGLLGINTTNPIYPLTVSGGVFSTDNEVSFLALNDASAIGLPIPVAGVQINAVASSGLISQILVYDTRGVNPSNPQVGFALMNQGNVGAPLERESRINANNGEEISIVVASGIDVINETIITRSEIEIAHDYIKMYGSGGFAGMHFDSVLGLFGFGTDTPLNTVDIGGSPLFGTLGLRFSARSGNSGQILGLNNNGDVVLLGNISGFGGGGGAQYWTQNGNDIYPSTLNNNVGIGITNPSTKLGVSGTVSMQQGNRGWEFANDVFAPGIDRIGGSFISGSEYVHQSIVDVFNGVPISNIGWFDTNTNQESNFTAFRQSATMHYNSNRLNINAGLWNGIDITANDVEIKYDQNNVSGAYMELNVGPLGFGINGNTFTHMFTNSGNVGINNINPSHTLSVSGSFIADDGGVGFESSTDILGFGFPGSMSKIFSNNNLGFLMAGNPGSNPLFNAGIGAYLGYVDLSDYLNERTTLSVGSGIAELTIRQNGLNAAALKMEPLFFSIESNANIQKNLFIDFSDNYVGINKDNPQKALDISGAIVSSAMVINGPFDGVIDVQNVNSIFIETSMGAVDIRGLANGSIGQSVAITKTNNGGSNLTVYNLSNSTNTDIDLGFATFTATAKRMGLFIYDGSVRYKN